MPRIVKSPSAEADLDRIWDYIAEISESQATAVLERIEDVILLLGTNPKLGRIRPELGKNIRSIAAENHIVFYRTIGVQVVEVIRVLHGAMDVPSQFE